MAPHSSTLAWKIQWTEEPGRLRFMGSLGVGHDWATSLSFFTFMNWRRKWQPTPVFLPGESQGRRAWWAAVYGVAQSRTRLKWLSRSSRAILRGAQVSVDQELAITVSWEDIVLPGFTRLFMFSDHFYFLSAMEKSIWVSLAITGSWEDS